MQDKAVTLRIDALKELEVEQIRNIETNTFWALQQTSNIDGFVTKMSLLEAANMSRTKSYKRHTPLTFSDRGTLQETLTMVSSRREAGGVSLPGLPQLVHNNIQLI